MHFWWDPKRRRGKTRELETRKLEVRLDAPEVDTRRAQVLVNDPRLMDRALISHKRLAAAKRDSKDHDGFDMREARQGPAGRSSAK
jgi:hypothetical protein